MLLSRNKCDKDGDGILSAEEKFLLEFDKLALGADAHEEEFPFEYIFRQEYEGKLRGLTDPTVRRYNGERCSLVNESQSRNSDNRLVLVKLQDQDIEMQVSKAQIVVVRDYDVKMHEDWASSAGRTKTKGIPETRSSVEVALLKLCGELRRKGGGSNPKVLAAAFFTVAADLHAVSDNKNLSQQAFILVCKNMELQISAKEIRLIWDTIDLNADGLIQKGELVKVGTQ
jgi:hypothetical protein